MTLAASLQASIFFSERGLGLTQQQKDQRHTFCSAREFVEKEIPNVVSGLCEIKVAETPTLVLFSKGGCEKIGGAC